MAGQLISDPKDRAARAAEKEQFVLGWLEDFIYSTTEILGLVLDLNPSATLSALRRLERKGYIIRDEIPVYGRIVLPIWGITITGLRGLKSNGTKTYAKTIHPAQTAASTP